MLPAGPMVILPDGKLPLDNLPQVLAESGKVFEGELIGSRVSTPDGLRVLVTRYEFRVHEWFKGGALGVDRTVVVNELGGEQADQQGMTTAESHKLALGGRYLVFLRKDATEVFVPFHLVLQVMQDQTIADKNGRLLVSVAEGIIRTQRTTKVASMRYLGTMPQQAMPADIGPPRAATPGCSSAPGPTDTDPDTLPPIKAEEVFRQVRPAGGVPPADPAPKGLPGANLGVVDYSTCGWISGAINYYCYVPNNNDWTYFTSGMVDWNTQVAGGGASTWMFGYFVDGGGNPIRNQLPTANNNQNNGGVVTSAQRTAGGYPTWAASGNPNGECFVWYTGGACTRIKEADTFVNPVNSGIELQFRKTAVHEMGHAFGCDHEDRYVAIMVSGTWRVVPNYVLAQYYSRADDMLAARQVMGFANGQSANSFVLNNWRDIATSAQAHPNWGTSGDIGPNVTTLNTYNANVGNTLTISHLFLENRGATAYSGTVTLSLYLSTNNIISSSDYLMGTWTWGSFAGLSVANNFSLNFTIPGAVPTGAYYIGWIVSSPEAQLTSGNDVGIIVNDSNSNFSQRQIFVTNNTPYNDNCSGALAISDGTYFGSTTFATIDGSTSCGLGGAAADIWYTYTATCSGSLFITTCGSNYDTVLSVHSGCPGTSANVILCNDDDAYCGGNPARQSALTIAASAGSTYYIRVAGYQGATGAVQLNASLTPNRPGNDDCVNAYGIGDGVFFGSTTCASIDGSGSCGTSSISPDVWYAYVPACGGVATISTCGSSYDTVLTVFDGCPSGGGTELACDDDGCGYPYSSIDLAVTSGQTYLIRVSGYSGYTGNFQLTTSVSVGTPANDNCLNAITIGNGSHPYQTCGATNGGILEAGCLFCCSDLDIHKDIWYRYIAQGSGTVSIDLCNSNFDSKVAVYAGGCPILNNTAIACNDDFCNGTRSYTSFTATQGSTYMIRVGGYAGNSGAGTMVINGPTFCYANCDGSSVVPVLTANDFQCFLNRFASNDPYANCDGSNVPPVLTANDFQCFLNAYAAGCP